MSAKADTYGHSQKGTRGALRQEVRETRLEVRCYQCQEEGGLRDLFATAMPGIIAEAYRMRSGAQGLYTRRRSSVMTEQYGV